MRITDEKTSIIHHKISIGEKMNFHLHISNWYEAFFEV